MESRMTERMLNLTLEVIYLLTGENYIAFKLSDGLVASRKTPNPVIDSPSHSLRENKKVEEVTREIIELLTGEVPNRCQDVSMVEWENFEGHKKLYKDVMMASQPALTSPDGSSNRNPPERCPRPLYSRNSTQEHQEIPQEDQSEILIQIAVKEEPYVMSGRPHNEEIEVPPEISTDTRATQTDLKPKVEEEEGPCPLYTWDFTHEHQEIHQDGQSQSLIRNKVKSEESYLWGDKPSKENILAEVITDGQIPGPFISLHGDIEVDNITSSFLGEHPIITNLDLTTCGAIPFSDLSTKESLPNDPPPIYHTIRRVSEKFPCSICGKSFRAGYDLVVHQREHLLESQYTCSICGKYFSRKLRLIEHKQSHLEKKRKIF